jgi:hypothetical protein
MAWFKVKNIPSILVLCRTWTLLLIRHILSTNVEKKEHSCITKRDLVVTSVRPCSGLLGGNGFQDTRHMQMQYCISILLLSIRVQTPLFIMNCVPINTSAEIWNRALGLGTLVSRKPKHTISIMSLFTSLKKHR